MAIIIDIKLNQQGGRPAAIAKLAAALEQLAKRQDEVNQKFIHMNTLVGRLSNSLPSLKGFGRGMGSGGSGGGGGRGPSVMKPPTVSQRFQQAYQEFQFFNQMHQRSGGKMGGAGRANALALSTQLANQMAMGGNFSGANKVLPHVMPKQGAGLGKKLMNLVASTRVGAGAGGMQVAPLIGRMAAVLGPAGLAAGAALMALTAAAVDAKNVMASFASDRATLGGSAAQTAMARAMAAAAGLDPNSASSSLREAIKSGAGAAYAAQAGINTTDGPFGDNNYSAKLIKALEFIRSASSFDEARRRAEGLGMAEAASSFYMSGGAMNRLKKLGSPMSDADMATSADLGANLAYVNAQFEKLKVEIFGPILQGFSDWIEILDMVGINTNKVGQALSGAAGGLVFFSTVIKNFLDWLAGAIPALNINVKAFEDNTKATNELNRTMKEGRNFYGGGGRARGALPANVKGQYLDGRIQDALGAGIPI